MRKRGTAGEAQVSQLRRERALKAMAKKLPAGGEGEHLRSGHCFIGFLQSCEPVADPDVEIG